MRAGIAQRKRLALLIASEHEEYRLIIAGVPMRSEQYWRDIQGTIERHPLDCPF